MRIAKWLLGVLVLALVVVLYFAIVLNWNYGQGENAGWVQKLSQKGWICKTWEGELALVSLPGSTPEKFLFTIQDDAVAKQVTAVMGKRVSLAFVQKVGLPTSCFGETRNFITGVTVQEEISLAPGVIVPRMPSAPASVPATVPPQVPPQVPAPVPTPVPASAP